MTDVVLFHHTQGLTDGVRAFADDLRAAGHTVTVPDLFDGLTFTTVEAGMKHAEEVLGMEEVIASHPDVAECAVLGVKDELKGEVPCGFVVLKSGVDRSPADLERELVGLVRDKIGPVAAFKSAITVGRLPKTRSGKILRGTMKKIADGDAYTMPATIEDAAVLDEVAAALKQHR